jgi:hypothetical protein
VKRHHADLTTDELFRLALDEQEHATGSGAEENLSYLVALHERATRATFDSAAQWIHSDVASQRRIGMRVLTELGQGNKPFEDEALDVLLPRLARVESGEELRDLVSAIGWQNRPRALPVLLSLVDHPNDFIRCLVANHIPGSLQLPGGGIDERGITALLKLTQDPDADVRYYATAAFEIDYPELDTDIIRVALGTRLRDDDAVVRRSAEEALRARGVIA